MSTSLLYHAYQISGVKYKSTEFRNGEVVFIAEMTRQYAICHHCGNLHVNFKGSNVRRFQMIPFGHKRCYLEVALHRLECPSCQHLWWPVLPFMSGTRRMVRSLIQYALELVEFCTIQAVADFLGVSWDTIKDLHKERLALKYKTIALKDVKAIGIDEFSISKGHEYMTVVIDLDEGRILHAVEGRDKESVIPFLRDLARKAPLLKVVAMDLSKSYAAAVRETLPHCDIVFDHFHVTALITKSLDDIRKEQQVLSNQQGLKTAKGGRFLLLMNYDKLDPRKRDSLEALLSVNQPLAVGYAMKEQFRLFWGKSSRREGAQFLCHWIIDAIQTGIKPLVKMGRSLLNHAEDLLNYFVYRVSNAVTEGINNKIKTLKRQAYGYRDLEYFKLRLYHLHQSRYAFSG